MPSRFRVTQIGVAFRTLGILSLLGMALLFLQSFMQPSWAAAWQYLFIGGLAAIVASGLGGLLGLIFGLPQSGVSVAKSLPGPQGAAAPTTASDDWYSDSSTLEKIATAATTAIIALSLANCDRLAERFDGVATAVGMAMQAGVGGTLDAAASSFGTALAASKDGKQGRESDEAFGARHKSSLADLSLAQAALDRTKNNTKVPGALLLGGYAVLAFATSYLWTRRYLPAELANARLAMRTISRQDAEDAAALEKARANKLEQGASKVDVDPALAADAVAKAQDPASATRSLAPNLDFVEPGAVLDDPWKGRFGGKSSDNRAQIAASVRELSGRPGLFLVGIAISGRDDAVRQALAGSSARLYLHPTFPNPVIRPVTFDANGEVALTLVAVGAFTLGVQFLPGGELLELDLATLRDAPTAFRLN